MPARRNSSLTLSNSYMPTRAHEDFALRDVADKLFEELHGKEPQDGERRLLLAKAKQRLDLAVAASAEGDTGGANGLREMALDRLLALRDGQASTSLAPAVPMVSPRKRPDRGHVLDGSAGPTRDLDRFPTARGLEPEREGTTLRTRAEPATAETAAGTITTPGGAVTDEAGTKTMAATSDADATADASTATTVREQAITQASRWAGITVSDNAEVQWEKLRVFFQTQNSGLATWLALMDAHATWSKREPAARAQYASKKVRRGHGSTDVTDLPKMGMLFRAIDNDMGIPPATAYRNITNAQALLDRFGRPVVEGMLGQRIALDGRVLRDLVRLKDERQCRDVIHIYTAGAGKAKANKALKAYLAVQKEKERDASSTSQGASQKETAQEQERQERRLDGSDAPESRRASRSSQTVEPGTAACEAKPPGRRFTLPRDGRVANGLRVVAVSEEAVELEWDDPSPTPDVSAVPDAPSSPTTNATTPSPPATVPFAFNGPAVDPIPSGATNVVRFTAKAADIAVAVKRASLVPPAAVTVDGLSGYLFTVSDDARHGYVATHDAHGFFAIGFPVRSIEHAGRFVYPAGQVHGFSYLGQDDLAFTGYSQPGIQGPTVYGSDTEALPENYVDFVSTRGASCVQEHTLDLSLFWNPASKITATAATFNPAVLRSALTAALPFLAKASADANMQLIQLVRGRNNGRLIASDVAGAVWFECDALRDRDLLIHRNSANRLLSFLGSCGDAVRVGLDERCWFARSENATLGWQREERALTVCRDERFPAEVLLSVRRDKALENLRMIRCHLPKRRGSIRVAYIRASSELRFLPPSGRSMVSMPARRSPGGPEGGDCAYEVDIATLTRLFDRAQAELVELHLGAVDPITGSVALVTVEEFEVGGHACRVTRWAAIKGEVASSSGKKA